MEKMGSGNPDQQHCLSGCRMSQWRFCCTGKHFSRYLAGGSGKEEAAGASCSGQHEVVAAFQDQLLPLVEEFQCFQPIQLILFQLKEHVGQ